jgi:hypothetical protein
VAHLQAQNEKVAVLVVIAAATLLIQDQAVAVLAAIQVPAARVALQAQDQPALTAEVAVVLLTLVKVMAAAVQDYLVQVLLVVQVDHLMDLQEVSVLQADLLEQDRMVVTMAVAVALVMMILTVLVVTVLKVLFVLCGVQVEHIQ